MRGLAGLVGTIYHIVHKICSARGTVNWHGVFILQTFANYSDAMAGAMMGRAIIMMAQPLLCSPVTFQKWSNGEGFRWQFKCWRHVLL